jgi:predicted DNA-binding helix-hairpin-helix protein
VRTSFKSEELARIFMNFYGKRYVSGIFLSSGIYDSPLKTMDEMIKTILILRNTYKFKGYVHLKILPGVEDAQIEEAIKIADRVSINLESPEENLLKRIAPEKRFKEEIFRAIKSIKNFDDKGLRVKSGFTTQFISGVLEETDFDLLKRTVMLYDEFNLRRAYFSGFSPVTYTPFENKTACPLMREHRLYQADFLMRLYGFKFTELTFDNGNLSLEKDPKEIWAEQHPELFPLELNKASYDELVRIPGIGIKSARRIIEERKQSALNEDKLKNMRVVLKRAHKYVLVSGKKVKYGRSKHEEEEATLFDFSNPYFAEV